ncbi:adaptin N terminal region-domain-containing protein [Lactarius hengduanensis]|nr:adaptin N terminal region-domain-containing protein [Lactarius hengduanensis]
MIVRVEPFAECVRTLYRHIAIRLRGGLPISHQLRTSQGGFYSYSHPELSPGTIVPLFRAFRTLYHVAVKDCNDRNPLIRALAIRTMSYIPIPVVLDNLTEQLRHHLKDRDPYVRKTAAICVAKLYAADPRKAERGGLASSSSCAIFWSTAMPRLLPTPWPRCLRLQIDQTGKLGRCEQTNRGA